jgi:hypothetical protein
MAKQIRRSERIRLDRQKDRSEKLLKDDDRE